MQIKLNGEARTIDISTSLQQFLMTHVDAKQGVAVALNNEVAPRSQWQQTELNEGDDITVFEAIAGG